MSKVMHEVSVDGGKYKFIARLGYMFEDGWWMVVHSQADFADLYPGVFP